MEAMSIGDTVVILAGDGIDGVGEITDIINDAYMVMCSNELYSKSRTEIDFAVADEIDPDSNELWPVAVLEEADDGEDDEDAYDYLPVSAPSDDSWDDDGFESDDDDFDDYDDEFESYDDY